MRQTPWTKYLLAFAITAFIFGTAVVTNNYFNDKRIEQIRSIQEGISIDILSLEAQFELLQEQSCESISEESVLSSELESLAQRLSYTEERLGADNEEVVRLKRNYSLLEIKDLLLMRKVSEKCGLEPIFILYFYSNKGDCDDCARQGYVLTKLTQLYPELRIYSFDYNIDLSAVQTLIILQNIKDELPALVINNQTYHGFKSVEEVEELVPKLLELREQRSATSTEEERR
jgi:hypothetical protein